MFSYEFCEIFKNTFFVEHLRWLLLFLIAYLGPNQTSTIQAFCENGQQVWVNDCFGKKSSIVDIWQGPRKENIRLSCQSLKKTIAE